MTLLWMSLCLSAGMIAGQMSLIIQPAAIWICAGCALVSAYCAKNQSRSLSWGALLLCLFALGSWRSVSYRSVTSESYRFNDSGVRAFSCVVVDDPVSDGLLLEFPCRLVSVDNAAVGSPVRVLVRRFHAVDLSYGDTVTLAGEIVTASSSEQFDYRAYLANHGLVGIVDSYGESVSVTKGSWSLQRLLFQWRRHLVVGLEKALPQPEASFIGGVIVGSEKGIPESIRDELRSAGLLHILVVSGYNVSLLMAGMAGLLRRIVGYARTFVALCLVAAVYTLLTGADPPVVRAAIMAVVASGALVAGRGYHGLTALAFASTSMAFFHPALVSDPSFQLSVVTTGGMVGAAPILGRFTANTPRWLAVIAETVGTTVTAQLASLPFVATYYGELPGFGLIANVAVLPLQGAQMVASIAAAIVAQISTTLANIVGLPAWLLARYSLRVGHIAARSRFASLPVGGFSLVVAGIYSFLLVLLVDCLGERYLLSRIRKAWQGADIQLKPISFALIVGIAAIALWTVALQLPDDRLHVAFLDVGQGDAILIRTPRGVSILVDGGPNPDVLVAHLGRVLPVWQRHVDVVVLTHPDLDHMGGILGLPSRYRITNLISPVSPVTDEWLEEWRQVEAVSGSVAIAKQGMRIAVEDGVVLDFLNPPVGGCPSWSEGDNNCSTVMRLEYGNSSFLLTGDAEGPIERFLVAHDLVQPTWLLKVGHHGSSHCTTTEFLRSIRPSLAVISVGDNNYNHPAEETLARLRENNVSCLRTDQQETIEIITDGEKYVINTGV